MRFVDNKLAVIILNLNGCAVTTDCLASLRKSRFVDFYTIVVDNGSTDDSVETIRHDYPEVEVIPTGENLGFTGGNNVGMQRALDRGCGALLLLNNDTILHEDCLGAIMSTLSADPALGAVTPKILFHDHPDRIWCAGGDFSLWRGIAKHRGLRDKADDARYASPADCTFITGCALCVKRDVVDKIGLLDNDLFIYNEDTDYSIRITRAGYRIRYVPDAILWHREGYDSRRASGQRRRIHLVTRNILRVHAKHRRWYHLLTFVPFFAFRWIGLSGGYALVRRDFATAAGILAGIRAYFRRETGPAPS
ncbi:MAG: glycosyltransferase family 2 protein [Candidatus Sumerlaeaceae bacterium]